MSQFFCSFVALKALNRNAPQKYHQKCIGISTDWGNPPDYTWVQVWVAIFSTRRLWPGVTLDSTNFTTTTVPPANADVFQYMRTLESRTRNRLVSPRKSIEKNF